MTRFAIVPESTNPTCNEPHPNFPGDGSGRALPFVTMKSGGRTARNPAESPLALIALVGLSAIGTLASCGSSPTPEEARPNVLLLTVDTLRADHLGVYGFSLPTSPHIDSLAGEGVVFDRAIAASASTAPAHASIMTSRYTRQHSIGYDNGGTKLVNDRTLAEHFSAAGYRTGAFVGNIMLQPRTGFDRGFDLFDGELVDSEPNRELIYERIAALTTERALAWLAQPSDRPVFLWVHYQDPHGPYRPPEIPADRLRVEPTAGEQSLPPLYGDTGQGGIPAYQIIEGLDRPSQYESLYAEEILYTDAWLGRLLEAFTNRAPGRESIVLLTADHGESLGENNYWFSHGHTTLPPLARVPFILRAPGLSPGRSDRLVSHVDVLPTLLGLAGLPSDPTARGIALGNVLRDETPVAKRFVYSDIGSEVSAYSDDGFIRISGTEGAWLPENSRSTETPQLWLHYTWQPGNPWQLQPSRRDQPAEIEAYLQSAEPMSRTPALELDDIERLRALGYGGN